MESKLVYVADRGVVRWRGAACTVGVLLKCEIVASTFAKCEYLEWYCAMRVRGVVLRGRCMYVGRAGHSASGMVVK